MKSTTFEEKALQKRGNRPARLTQVLALLAAAWFAGTQRASAAPVGSNLFDADFRDYALTVASDFGNPLPPVGITNCAWHATVTCSVENVIGDGMTNRLCVGWTGTGSVPSFGVTTNTGSLLLANLASSVSWQWQTQYRLAAETNGNGTVTAGGWFNSGSNATLTATAAANWHFVSWAGDTNGCAAAGDTLTAPMTQARSVTAVFSIDQETLTVVSAKGGESPGSVTVDYGTTLSQWVTNSPVAYGATQYVCTAGVVSGNAYMAVNPTNVTLMLTNNATLTWQWQTQYRLTADTNGSGMVTAGGWFNSGSNATLTATAAANWHFVSWTGDTNGCTAAGNTLTAPMTQARSVTAVFAVDQKTLTVASAWGGAKPGTVTTNWGTLVSQWVTNSPVAYGATQYVCTAGVVSGNAYTQVNPTNVTVTLTNSAILTWQWQAQYRLTTGTNGNGTVTAGGWFNSGSNATLTATAAANWHFAGWSGDTNGCAAAGNTLTAPMTQARSVTAVFTLDQKTLTVASAWGGAIPGTVTTNWGALVSQWVTNSPAVFGATQYVCTAASVGGNAFTQVNPTNVTLMLTNNATLTWQWQTQYRLMAGTNGSGTVTTGGWFGSGSNATLTANAAANWHFVSWAGDTSGCAIAGSTLTAPMTQARVITAYFEIDTYGVTFVLGAHGIRTGGGELSQTVAYGDAAIAPEVLPQDGWSFDGWDTAFDNVTGPLTVTAAYTQILNTLTVTSEHGGATPGTLTVDYGTGLSQWVTNSPVLNGSTQYVCGAGIVTGNDFIQNSTTNVTLTLTNNATLLWQWRNLHLLTTATNGNGMVTAGGWFDAESNAVLTAASGTGWHFAGWAGDTNGCVAVSNTLTAPMTQARSLTAVFEVNTKAPVTTYDLKTQFSTTSNPYGRWSYVWNYSPITQKDAYHYGGWGYIPAHDGTIFKCNATQGHDMLPLDVQLHTLSQSSYGGGSTFVGVLWTSPQNGYIALKGRAWDGDFAGGRDASWTLRAAGDLKAQHGSVYGLYRNDAAAQFANNVVSGKSLSGIPVSAGTVVAWHSQTTTAWGHFMGVDLTVAFSTALESSISVESPVGSNLVCGVSALEMGLAAVGHSGAQRTITINNSGTKDLIISGVTTLGDNAGDFNVNTAGMSMVVEPMSSTAFAVALAPTATGVRSTVLQIVSDDPVDGMFNIVLYGEGLPNVDCQLSVTSPHGVCFPPVGVSSYLCGSNLTCWVTGVDAVGATQYVCTGWTGSGNVPAFGGTTNVSFMLTNDSALAWQWQTQYRLTTGTNGNGTMTAGGWFDPGSNATLTANAAANWHFVNWAGDTNGCSIAGNVLTAPMTRARSVTAVFAVDQETLTVASAWGGTKPGTVTTNWGTLVSQWVTNSPVVSGTTQYVCTAGVVSGNAYTAVNPTNVTVTLTNNATLTWQWQTQYRLTTGTNGNGTVTAGGWFGSGSNATVTATAAANWHFVSWAGDTNGCAIAGNALTAPMTQARAVTAVFASDVCSLTVESLYGTARPVPGTHLYAWGANVTCQVSYVETGASVQYVCYGWSGSGSVPQTGLTTNVTLTITNSSSIVWQWSTNYWIDAVVSGSGSVAGVSGFLPIGSESAFTATAGAGFAFSGWGGDWAGCVVHSEIVTVRVDRARVLVANFRPVPVYGLTAQVAGLNSVRLAWSYGGLAGGTFRVERLTAGGSEWQTLGTVAGTAFVDDTVVEGLNASYRVVAVVGGFDSAGAEVQVEVPYLPAVPTGVAATALSSSAVSVSWDAAARASGYVVQRRLLPLGDWATVATLGAVTGWTDASVVGGLRYTYRLRSVNAAGNSAFSVEVSVVVPADPGAWNYGMQVSNAVITVSGESFESATNVLCGAPVAATFDALLSNPDGVHVQHRVVSGLRDTNGVSVGSVVEINELTGAPSQPPVWVTGATVPDGLRIPAKPGTYLLWIEDYLDADDPCAAFVDTVNTNETLLTHPVAVFTAVPPGVDDAYVKLGSEAECAGKTVDVPITVSAIGGENAFSFSLNYDASKIRFRTIKPGATAASCYIEVNDTVEGSLGVLMILPVNTGLESGLQELASVKLFIDESVSAGYPIALTFGNTPAYRMVVDAYGNVLPHVWHDGVVTVAGVGYEADVSPRGKPDDKVDDKDKKQIYRFVAGLDVPEPGSEFQRADCAPIETRGDGRVDACDAVVATRYAAGEEPLKDVGGPTEPLSGVAAAPVQLPIGDFFLPLSLSAQQEQVFTSGLAGLIKIDATFGVRGEVLAVPVNLVSGGNIEGASFSVRFDPDQLMFLDAVPSAVCSNALGVLNDKGVASGVVGYLMRMPPGQGLPVGSANVLTLYFRVVPAASDIVSAITVDAEPAPVVLSNGSGVSVAASVQGANVYLLPVATEGAPDPVGDLSVSVEGGSRVRLTWSDVAGETGYALYRRSECEIWGLLAELPPDTVSYVDSGLEPGRAYSYRIASVNTVAERSSDSVSITVPTRYRYWADVHIGLSLGEPDEDPDHDGISNYLEYLMGSDPVSPESGLLRTGFEDMYGFGDDYFTMSFDVNDWALPSLSVDTTDSLVDGVWLTATEIQNTASNGVRHLKFRTQWPMSASPKQFIRVKTLR